MLFTLLHNFNLLFIRYLEKLFRYSLRILITPFHLKKNRVLSFSIDLIDREKSNHEIHYC